MADAWTLEQRASAGEARAQYEWGARLLVGRDAPHAPAAALALLNAAAAQDEADALQLLAVLAALGEGQAQSWTKARSLVERAAALGNDCARRQLQLIGDDLGAWLSPPPPHVRFEAPRIATIEAFIPRSACAWIVEKAAASLTAARVKNPLRGGSGMDSYRSNTGMGFSVLDTDLLMQLIYARIAAALAIPMVQQEPANVLHYEPGQEYKPHFDYFDPGVKPFQSELTQIGQRVATFLIYLNDDFEGGETEFTRLNWRCKGEAGDALLFWNVTPDGRPDPTTLHAGLPPTVGEKWLFSKWVRDRPLPLI